MAHVRGQTRTIHLFLRGIEAATVHFNLTLTAYEGRSIFGNNPMSMTLRDRVERVLLCLFVGWLAWRIGYAIYLGSTSWVSGLILVDELMVLAFVMFGRRAKDVSTSAREWILAFAGSAAPLLVQPGGTQLAPTLLLAFLFMISIFAQVAAKLSLNRSFGIVPANRGVVTKGLYSFVRHPVYASYLLGHIAFWLTNPTLWNFGVYVVAMGLQVMRILAEEGLLSRDPEYAAYRLVVRYRLVPGVF